MTTHKFDNGMTISYDTWFHKMITTFIVPLVQKKDFDWMFLITGMERSGKSTLAQQLALLCDPTFNINKIAFTGQQFTDCVLKAKRNDAIVFDEAYEDLDSRNTLSEVTKSITHMLSRIGNKNLFIFILLPDFFSLTRNIACWRSKTLLRVTLYDGMKRGRYDIWPKKEKDQLYNYGKRFYNYNAVKRTHLRGAFSKKFVVDKGEYNRRKEAVEFEESNKETVHDSILQRNVLISRMRQDGHYTSKEIAEMFTDANCKKITLRTIQQVTKNEKRV